MSVWTRTLKATPPERQRAISSASTTVARKSAPLPPYSVSNSRPRKPSSPRRRHSSLGMRPAASHSATRGAISFSTKAWIDRRSISCSSVNSGCAIEAADYSAEPAAAGSAGWLGPPSLHLAKLRASNLAADRLRQVGDELDLARILVGGGHRLDVLLQLARERVRRRAPGREHHERLDDLAAERVGLADDGGLGDRGVLDQGGFDLERPDAIRGAVDYVVGAAHEPEVAVAVHRRAVAGDVPVAAMARRRRLGIAPVLLEHPDWTDRPHADGEITFRAARDFMAVVVDDGELVTGGGRAHGAGPPRRRRERRGEEHGLGLAVAFVDVVPRTLTPRLDDLRVHGLAGPEAMAQGGEAILRERLLHEHAVRGGWRKERGDRIAREHLERRGGLEALAARVPHEERCSHVPRREEARPRGLRPAGVGDRPVEVFRIIVEPELAGDHVTDGIRGVAVEHHLGKPGRARREVDHHRLVAGVAGMSERRRGARHETIVFVPACRRAAEHDPALDGRAFAEDLVDLPRVLLVGDHDRRVADGEPVLDVLGRHQRRARHRDHASADAPENDLPPLPHARQHDEDALAGSDAEPGQDVGEAPRALAELGERKASRLTVARYPQERELGGIARPGVEGVERPVVARGDVET